MTVGVVLKVLRYGVRSDVVRTGGRCDTAAYRTVSGGGVREKSEQGDRGHQG